MASRIARKEWMRGLPSAIGEGRYERKLVHSASERSVGYVFLIEESVQNHPNPHPYQTGSEESPYSRRMRHENAGEAKFERAHPHQRWLSYGRRSRCAVCWSSVARTSGSLRSSTTPWRIFGLDKSFKARVFLSARGSLRNSTAPWRTFLLVSSFMATAFLLKRCAFFL